MKARLHAGLWAALLVLAGLWATWPALAGGWLSDDTLEITANPDLGTLAGLGRIWRGVASPDYFPIKGTVQWAEWHLWGARPAGYHAVNLGLHLLGGFLVWRLLRRLGLRSAPWGGLLFVVHPLAVESVAWISELKNTLSLPPMLLAFGCFAAFDAVPPASRRGLPWAGLAWFTVAMLCKSSVVMLPVVLLLYAWWRRGRVGRPDILAVLPFAAISLLLGLVTLHFQAIHAMKGVTLPIGGLASRVAAAGISVSHYLAKAVVPEGLAFIYPKWAVVPPSPRQFLPGLALVALACWLVARPRTDGYRHVLLGAGWFAVNLAPVLGFAPMAYLRMSWVADHFAYVPLVGLVGLAALAIDRWKLRGLAAGAALALALLARQHAAVFADEESLWTATVRQTPGSAAAHNNLGLLLLGRDRTGEALAELGKAVRLEPDYPEARNNLGSALLKAGRTEEAMAEFERTIRIDPYFAEPLNNLGNALGAQGRPAEAEARYREALRLKPGYADAAYDLGLCLVSLGRPAEAIPLYERALRLRPDFPEARNNLGVALARTGRLAEAVCEYGRALRLRPDFAEAENNLGLALAKEGRLGESVPHFEAAIRLNPGYVEARHNLRVARQRLSSPP